MCPRPHIQLFLNIQLLLVFVCVGVTWAADIQISTDERTNVADPAVTRQSTGETFFVWAEDFIVGRRFDAMGNPIDPQPFQISMPTIGGEGNPDVAMNDSGQAVVVWQEFTERGQLDIFARLYTFCWQQPKTEPPHQSRIEPPPTCFGVAPGGAHVKNSAVVDIVEVWLAQEPLL